MEFSLNVISTKKSLNMKNLSALLFLFFLLNSCSTNNNQETNNQETPLINESNGENQFIKDGSLSLFASTDNAFYYIDEPRENVYLYTELKADYFKKDMKRTPLNLSIVIDRSGSMEGEKLNYAKEAAIQAIGLLSAEDYVSIISYEDGVQVVQEATFATNKEEIIAKIKRINSGGSTFLSGGMIKGFEAVKENYKENYLNRVFLLSDGLANEGITDEKELARIAASWKQNENISLSTFGIGTGFNEDLMTELAEYGRGNYYFINEAKNIPSIFEKEMNGLLSLVAKDLVLRISYPGAALQLERVFGYTYDAKANEVSINLGEMYSEETKAVLFKFSLDKFYKDDLYFESIVDYEDLSLEKPEKKHIQLISSIRPIEDAELVKASVNNLTMQQITLFESNTLMEEAAEEIDKGNYELAKDILKRNEEYIKQSEEKFGSTEEIERQKEANNNYSISLEDYENMSLDEQEYIQKSNKMTTYEIKKKK